MNRHAASLSTLTEYRLPNGLQILLAPVLERWNRELVKALTAPMSRPSLTGTG